MRVFTRFRLDGTDQWTNKPSHIVACPQLKNALKTVISCFCRSNLNGKTVCFPPIHPHKSCPLIYLSSVSHLRPTLGPPPLLSTPTLPPLSPSSICHDSPFFRVWECIIDFQSRAIRKSGWDNEFFGSLFIMNTRCELLVIWQKQSYMARAWWNEWLWWCFKRLMIVRMH